MKKDPKYDLRYQYRRAIEASAAVSLLLIVLLLMAFKKFDVDVKVRALDAPAIQVEDIPITRTIKKIEVPRKPTIPIEDPEVDPADNVDIPNIDIFNPDVAPPPPPPPEEDEIVPFFKVERKPELIGGLAAISEYISKNNLYPRFAAENNITGKVMIGFVVDKEGNTTDLTVIDERPPNLGFGEAGLKTMQALKFSPGFQRDRPVPVRMSQPITFKTN
ncbi:MAG: TonB family protein [Calditrichota bacterium]